MRWPSWIAQVATCLLLAGCRLLSGPADDLPEPDLSLDPARVRIGPLLWSCGGWSLGRRPPGQERTVDVYFPNYVETDQPLGDFAGPKAANRYLIRRFGGTILWSFNVPVVRARVPIDSIPLLSQSALVFGVPELSRYDVLVGVEYRRSAPFGVADSLAFVRLGAVVIDGVAGDLIPFIAVPNRSVPAIRRLTGVATVHVVSSSCLF